ncbi:MAG: hypothetical protein U0168_21180 [Nannocystaceae bacterium]
MTTQPTVSAMTCEPSKTSSNGQRLRARLQQPTFGEFFADLGIEIDQEFPEGSKANRLRAFLRSSDAPRVAQALEALLDHRGHVRDGDDASTNIVKVKNGSPACGRHRWRCRASLEADVLSLAYVHELEIKIDQRLSAADLEGAITAARTMLEAMLAELEKQPAGAPGDQGQGRSAEAVQGGGQAASASTWTSGPTSTTTSPSRARARAGSTRARAHPQQDERRSRPAEGSPSRTTPA